METRTLGRTGLLVSALGFGASELGWDRVSQADVDQLIGAALEAGLSVIDTSACYFDSEEKLGRALAGRPRNRYCLFTKCGHALGLPFEDWAPELVMPSLERSLQRLGTDHVDVVQLHSCSTETLRDGALIEALERARDAGKTRFIGYSGDGEDARYAVECGAFDTLQTSINLADQQALDLTLPLARERGMGVIAKRPIANVAWRLGRPSEDGHVDTVLDGRGYTDAYARRFRALDLEALRGPLQDAVAFALRFTLSQEGVATAIVGTTRPGRWEQNARLLAAGPLAPPVAEAVRARWHAVAEPDWTGQT